MKEDQVETRKNYFVWFLVITIACLSAREVILAPRNVEQFLYFTHTGHAWDYNIWRIIGLSNSLLDGTSGRWIHSFSHGWGYPLFYYTGPLPYLIGAILSIIGFEVHASLNIVWLLCLILAPISMFLFLRDIFGRWSALLGATCYAFAPYHLVDVYIRTNLGESFSFIFLPLIAWSLVRVDRGRLLIGAVAVAGVCLSHLVSVVLVGLTVLAFGVSLIAFSQSRKEQLFHSAKVLALGMALSAFFWLPAVADVGAVHGTSTLVDGYNHYSNHFVYFTQLFSSFWGFGQSEKGINDHMSFSLGQVIVVLALIGMAFVCVSLINNRKELEERTLVSSFVGLFVAIFFTNSVSAFLWEMLPAVEIVQFPWRFLFPASFFVSLIAASVASYSKKLALPVALLSSFLVVYFHWGFNGAWNFDRVHKENLNLDYIKARGINTTNDNDFLPKQVLKIPNRARSGPIVEASRGYEARTERILSTSLSNGSVEVELLPGEKIVLRVNQYWHPAWRAWGDGKPLQIKADKFHPYGLIRVTVPEGVRKVKICFSRTGWGYFGLVLSLIAVSILLAKPGEAGLRNYLVRVFKIVLFVSAILATAWFFRKFLVKSAEDVLVEDLKSYKPSVLDFAAIRSPIVEGASWDDSRAKILPLGGVIVAFNGLRNSNTLEISLDHNDLYQVLYLNNSKLVGRSLIREAKGSSGLTTRLISIPQTVREQKFNYISIRPLKGDGMYSLGHLRLLSKELKENSKIKEVNINSIKQNFSEGAQWNLDGNITFKEPGLRVRFNERVSTYELRLSTDSNDYYVVSLVRDARVFQRQLLKPNSDQQGMIKHKIHPREEMDYFVIQPVLGDGYYSLGHVSFEKIPVE